MKFKLKLPIQSFHTLASKRYFQLTGFLSIVLLGLTTLLPIWQLFPGLQDQFAIPLHYNIHFGIDLFGPWWQIFTIPFAGLLALIINAIGMLYSWKKDKVLSYFFATATVLVELILFVAMIFVVLLNLAYGI
ncbi:MAG: hypothetical protein ABIA47_04250 [bacterium]